MNWICCNCKWVTEQKPSKCQNCNGQTFEQTLGEVTPLAEAIPVKELTIKDKITPGPWRNDARGEKLMGSEGHQVGAYGLYIYHPLSKTVEAVANTRLIQAAPEMLDILERFSKLTVLDNDERIQLQEETVNLLNTLNK